MSRSDTNMVFYLALVEIFCSLMVNGFITVTKLMDWWDGRKLKPFDKMFLSLGLSRVFLMFLVILNIINRVFSLNFHHVNVLSWMLDTVYLSLDFSSLWFSMWLCVLYYLKVVIFKNTLLIRMKLRIPELVLYMMTSSLVIAFLSGFIFAYNFDGTSDVMIPPRNQEMNASMDKQIIYLLPSYFMGNFVPFIMVSVSASFLVHVIYGHVRHLRSSITSFTTPNVDAHLSAIRSVVMIEVMTIFNFIVAILLRFDFHDICHKGVLFLFAVLYHILHPMALIAGNAKLKKTALEILHHLKKCGTTGKPCTKPQVAPNVDTITKTRNKKSKARKM